MVPVQVGPNGTCAVENSLFPALSALPSSLPFADTVSAVLPVLRRRMASLPPFFAVSSFSPAREIVAAAASRSKPRNPWRPAMLVRSPPDFQPSVCQPPQLNSNCSLPSSGSRPLYFSQRSDRPSPSLSVRTRSYSGLTPLNRPFPFCSSSMLGSSPAPRSPFATQSSRILRCFARISW